MVELVLLARAEQVDLLSDALTDELDALAVTVEDADADTPDEAPIFGEPGMPATLSSQIGGWKRSIVKALFADEDSATEAATLLLAQDDGEDGAAPAPLFEDLHVQGLQPVADEDWVRLTQSQFEPVLITSDFWIVPSWHKAPEGATRVMRLDPGLAFGTGSHPTTRLCLEWLRTHVHAGASVLDYGCGSGILAIAAAKLGAGRATGVDIDANALAAAEDNATRNGVVLQLMHSRQPLDTTFDIVVANILTNPLCVLAPLLTERTCLGGQLVLSGILASQVAQVQEAYRPGFDLEFRAEREGWALLAGHRRC